MKLIQKPMIRMKYIVIFFLAYFGAKSQTSYHIDSITFSIVVNELTFKDDIDYFETLLSTKTRKFQSVTRGIGSYGSGEWSKSYDHIILSNDIRNISTKGYKACAKTANYNETFIPYISFKKYYSDHCPVMARVSIPSGF